MTETTSGQTSSGQITGGRKTRSETPKVRKGGLTIGRVWTTPGVHPYDEVTWERRDVVQTNWKTGETIFEQKGVEFPASWSLNASTIVTTKYFRGALGTDVREWSLKQLVDRVVLTYVKAGRPERRGLTVERVHTTPGVHPYDEVTWQRRDVVMTNWRDGTVNFEQRGVEFPEFWSVNATNIVTSKYFRGAAGSSQRESSLRQLIDRVVGVYHRAGLEHGYFATENDAEIFEHELTWLLVNQYFSFNSPVWFNVGTPSPQQVSACFILSVDDSMDSILNWYKEEGFIFKGGSGAGLNLSRIRSSKELLSSGGTASGPVSFMRGADACWGTPATPMLNHTGLLKAARWVTRM